MAQMTTDAEVLAKEAGNFERIAGELKDTIARVEQAANELVSRGVDSFTFDFVE